jgi:chromosome segregation ATPase
VAAGRPKTSNFYGNKRLHFLTSLSYNPGMSKQLDEQTLRSVMLSVIHETVTPELQAIHIVLNIHTAEIKEIRVQYEMVMDEIQVIHECLQDIGPMKQDIAILKEDMREVKADIKVMKAVLIDHNTQLDDHEHRLMHLEAM